METRRLEMHVYRGEVVSYWRFLLIAIGEHPFAHAKPRLNGAKRQRSERGSCEKKHVTDKRADALRLSARDGRQKAIRQAMAGWRLKNGAL
jgi:hypothetical protein